MLKKALAAAVDRLTPSIHGAIEVHPAATSLDVRLVHAPRARRLGVRSDSSASRTPECNAAPAQDRAGCEGDTAFAIIATMFSVREFVLEVPANAKDDDRGIEMAALEDCGEAQQLCSPGLHSRTEHRASN